MLSPAVALHFRLRMRRLRLLLSHRDKSLLNLKEAHSPRLAMQINGNAMPTLGPSCGHDRRGSAARPFLYNCSRCVKGLILTADLLVESFDAPDDRSLHLLNPSLYALEKMPYSSAQALAPNVL